MRNYAQDRSATMQLSRLNEMMNYSVLDENVDFVLPYYLCSEHLETFKTSSLVKECFPHLEYINEKHLLSKFLLGFPFTNMFLSCWSRTAMQNIYKNLKLYSEQNILEEELLINNKERYKSVASSHKKEIYSLKFTSVRDEPRKDNFEEKTKLFLVKPLTFNSEDFSENYKSLSSSDKRYTLDFEERIFNNAHVSDYLKTLRTKSFNAFEKKEISAVNGYYELEEELEILAKKEGLYDEFINFK